MSFTKMTDDLNIIQGLPDLPNDVGGLTAAQLKATYDKAGLLLKKYINEVLIPEIEGNGGAANVGISEIEGVNATTVQRALEILRGQLMEATAGVIPDGSITTAKYANESVTGEKLADGAVGTSKISDGAITNDKIESVKSDKIDGNVSNIADDVIATDKIKNFAVTQNKLANAAVTEEKISAGAVTGVKIANGAVSEKFTATIHAAGWIGEAAPYTNAITVTGLLAKDTPIVDMIPSETYETAEAGIEAYATIYRMVAADNQLTVYATEKPTVDINIQLRAVRK